MKMFLTRSFFLSLFLSGTGACSQAEWLCCDVCSVRLMWFMWPPSGRRNTFDMPPQKLLDRLDWYQIITQQPHRFVMNKERKQKWNLLLGCGIRHAVCQVLGKPEDTRLCVLSNLFGITQSIVNNISKRRILELESTSAFSWWNISMLAGSCGFVARMGGELYHFFLFLRLAACFSKCANQI